MFIEKSRSIIFFLAIFGLLLSVGCASSQQSQDQDALLDSEEMEEGQGQEEAYQQGDSGNESQAYEDDDLQGAGQGNSFDEDLDMDDSNMFEANNQILNGGNNQLFSNQYGEQEQMGDEANQGNLMTMDELEKAAAGDSEDMDWNPDRAELNRMKFRVHFASVMAGHGEGVFYVVEPQTRVYLGPNDRFEIVGILSKGDSVHGIKLQDQWLKIGRTQYVRLKDVRNAGLRTKGIGAYKMSRKDLARWKEKIRIAEERMQSQPVQPEASVMTGDDYGNSGTQENTLQENQYGDFNQFQNSQDNQYNPYNQSQNSYQEQSDNSNQYNPEDNSGDEYQSENSQNNNDSQMNEGNFTNQANGEDFEY